MVSSGPLVLDASAMVDLLVRAPAAEAVRMRLLGHDVHVPSHFDAEVCQRSVAGVSGQGQSSASSSSLDVMPRTALPSAGSKASGPLTNHSTLRATGSTMRNSSTPERK